MSSEAVVNLVVNATQGEAQITAQLRRIVNDAERRAPIVDLRVSLDTRRVERELNLLGTRLNASLGAVNDSIQDGFRDLTGELTRSLTVISNQLGDVNRNLRTMDDRLNDLNSNNALRHVGDDADRAEDRTDRLSSALSRIGSASRGLALGTARATAFGAAIGGSVQLVASLATAVENLAPAAAVAVSGFVAMQAASLTLKIGLSGVEDAISAVFDPSTKPEQLEKALDGLSENARSFVKEIIKAKPAIDRFRESVQDRVFAGLDKTLATTAKTTFPILRRAALDFAGTFNVMAKNTANTAQDLSKDGSLGRALKSGSDAFDNLSRVPSRVLEAIIRLADAGGPQLERLTDKVAEVADNLTVKLRDAAKSGALQDAVKGAVDAIAQLGRITQNVFGTIGNILGVADDSGKGLFGTLESVTAALESGTETPLFQRVLKSLIDLSQTLTTNILPLLGQAFAILAPVVLTIVPPIERLVELLGDRLGEILPALAPVLDQLAVNFGLLLDALTPLIDNALTVLVAIMPSLLDLMNSMSVLITNLAPLIEELAPLIAVLLVGGLVVLIETISFVVTTLGNLFLWIQFVIDRWKDFASTVIDIVIEAFQLVIDLITGDFSGAWEHLQNIVGDVAGFIGRTVSGLKDTLVRIIGNLADLLPSGMRRVFDRVAQAVKDRASAVAGAARDIGSRLLDVITGLGPAMFRAGAAIVSSLADGIISKIGDAVGAISSVAGEISKWIPHSPAKKGPFSGRGYPLYSGQAIIDSMATGILQRSGAVQAAMAAALGGGLTPSLALAGTGSTLTTPTGTAGATGTLAAAGSSVFLRAAAPTVNVHIGNEAITRYVRTVVDDANDQRDRLAAQGTRI